MIVTPQAIKASMQLRVQLREKMVGTTLCGGNVDAGVFAKVLAGV